MTRATPTEAAMTTAIRNGDKDAIARLDAEAQRRMEVYDAQS